MFVCLCNFLSHAQPKRRDPRLNLFWIRATKNGHRHIEKNQKIFLTLPRNLGLDSLLMTTDVQILKSSRSRVFVYRASIHTNRSTRMHIRIVTKWSLYPPRRTTSMARIVTMHWQLLHENRYTLGYKFETPSHTRTVVRECCKGDDASQWGNGKFDPMPLPHPNLNLNALTDHHQQLYTWLCRGYLPTCKI